MGGFVALNLPVADYGKQHGPVIDMAAAPISALRPASALKPTLRTQSLRALPRNELELSKAKQLQMKAMEGCEHYLGKVMKGAAVAAPLLKGCEAMALVDERLAGEGTGKALGVNDPALVVAIVVTFFTVWILWFGSQKFLGDDSGLDIS